MVAKHPPTMDPTKTGQWRGPCSAHHDTAHSVPRAPTIRASNRQASDSSPSTRARSDP